MLIFIFDRICKTNLSLSSWEWPRLTNEVVWLLNLCTGSAGVLRRAVCHCEYHNISCCGVEGPPRKVDGVQATDK